MEINVLEGLKVKHKEMLLKNMSLDRLNELLIKFPNMYCPDKQRIKKEINRRKENELVQ